MSDNRKIVNSLLNASVTGGTLEEFSQNAVLLPAAEKQYIMERPTPPQQLFSQESSVPKSEFNYNSGNQIQTLDPLHSAFPQSTTSSYFNQQDYPQGIVLEEYPLNQRSDSQQTNQLQVSPIATQPPISQIEEQPLGFQSVISSFSSYLKIGGGRQAEQESQPVPSVVDTVLSTVDPNEVAPPVQLYSPADTFNSITPLAGPPVTTSNPSGNSYRRGGFKRPAYAPIPGLTSSTTISPSQIPDNLPPQSTPLYSQFAPPVANPLPCAESHETFVIPKSSSPNLPPPRVQQINPTQTTTSPFLSPVLVPEEIQFAPLPPTLVNSGIPTPYPPVLHTAMANNDSPRASPALGVNYRTDSTDQSILTSDGPTFLYRPVYHHWFFKKVSDSKTIWLPFSMQDSLNLESAYLSPDLSPEKLVATEGGRFDVNILLRERIPVYWKGPTSEVRRCSWFHKSHTDGRFVPYEENIATKLEEEFKIAFESNTWNRKMELPNGDTVVFHGPDVLVLFPPTQCPDSWGNTPNQPKPRVIKRGLDEFHIEEGEPQKIDHLLFLVHGIGSVCDLKFRGVEEVVDEFRNIALQLVQSHYRTSCEREIANRIEVLPISWHGKLHSEDTGVDRKLKGITLESIPRLREFTNDTILDVLFYTSPLYCQTIISTVGNEINRIYDLFKQRNPAFTGGVSLGGHSLGSLILFDILCHQHPKNEKTEKLDIPNEDDELATLEPPPDARKISRRISYMMGKIGTGHPQINYPHLAFNPCHFFALGSPVGMFVTVRGLDTLGEQFALPTCPAYFNIFHPYDPVAYRVESLVNPELANLKPVLIPHHKGRKRMHLELKETMARVGADLKQKLIDSMKSTWNSFYQFTLFKGQGNQSSTPNLEDEVNKVLEEQLGKDDASDEDNVVETEPTDLSLGTLNQGRRIDYVLQEAPLEFFNEYIFALTSHVCYWESEDTILLIVKEIYNSKNISADNQIPQQTMKIERTMTAPMSSNENRTSTMRYGMDPTVPMSDVSKVGPPPLAGFVRKS